MEDRLAKLSAANAQDTQDYIDTLFMRAYMPLTWVLMARTMEVRALTNDMLVMDVPHEAYPDRPGLIHIEVKLTFRKTNQADPNKANMYKLFDLPEEPAAHVRSPLRNWLTYVRARSFEDLATLPQTLVFPQFDGAGTPQYQTPWTDKVFRKALNSVIVGSGIMETRWGPGTFKSHSLRRGCAQHRAMHMLPHKRWSLEQIRWWGGWAPSESNEILMRYILEAHDRQQNYYGDSMDPYRMVSSLNHAENYPSGPAPSNHARLADIAALETRTLSVVHDLRAAMDTQLHNVLLAVQGLYKQPAPRLPMAMTTMLAPSASSNANVDRSNSDQVLDIGIPSTTLPSSAISKQPIPTIPDAGSIADVIEQWERPNPPYHVYALKDWPAINPRWSRTATVRSRWCQRKRIYEAYVKYADQSIARFHELFGTRIGSALKNIAAFEGTQRPERRGQKYNKSASRKLLAAVVSNPPRVPRVSAASSSEEPHDFGDVLSPATLQAHVQAAEAIELHASQGNPYERRPGETDEEYNVRQLRLDQRSPSTERRELAEAAERARASYTTAGA